MIRATFSKNAARCGLLALILAGCVTLGPKPAPALKDAFKDDFLIGASINAEQFTGRDERGAALIKKHFNSITPENALKWGEVHPALDRYDFETADKYVAFGESNQMFIIGHTLVWHNHLPPGLFEDAQGRSIDRDMLLKRLHDHIFTVVGRYKGRIQGWDVVNEALNEDGTLRQSPWMKIIGEDYIAKAFTYAHEADPAAQLHYNDYSLDNERKRNGAIALIKKLQAQGIPITAVGLQEHDRLDSPTPAQVDATISAFAKLGVKVMITEVDVDVLPRAPKKQGAPTASLAAPPFEINPYTNGLPDAVQKEQARRYAELFRVFVKHRRDISRVTFWNVTDADSWLNNFPVKGRTNYPLLFDREGNPKPAYYTVIETAGGH